MRWYPAELESAFPNTFHTGLYKDNLPLQINPWPLEEGFFLWFLLRPIIYYLSLWCVPYFVTIFWFRAERIRERGYSTMYSVYEKSLDRYLNVMGPSLRPVVYMLLHASLSTLAFSITPFLWSSYWLNTIYLLALMLVSIWNGATYYFEVFAAKLWRAGRLAGIAEMEHILEQEKLQLMSSAVNVGDDAMIRAVSSAVKKQRTDSLDEGSVLEFQLKKSPNSNTTELDDAFHDQDSKNK